MIYYGIWQRSWILNVNRFVLHDFQKLKMNFYKKRRGIYYVLDFGLNVFSIYCTNAIRKLPNRTDMICNFFSHFFSFFGSYFSDNYSTSCKYNIICSWWSQSVVKTIEICELQVEYLNIKVSLILLNRLFPFRTMFL